ncbi:uncharacterized protein SAPINGB_P000832 [Magnusiomyces paraingens]|uniref:Uncharacterized protein n=1 Tax=Magnusiomyces paraingens TaxID=2606893 RepID=A0A5E8B374_9ASCO|nr:uncharacterized protein SAPINGB_P000832 [Saprochaete ingens]VVT45669.1 unnamed protein product [Saprochaete ingens]
MASAPNAQPWYNREPADLKKLLEETRAKEIEWLLKDTKAQVRATVASNLRECRDALAASPSPSDINGSENNTDKREFRLVVSSGRTDLVKGVLVRVGTQLVDFDIKVKLLAAGTHGVTIGGSPVHTPVGNGPQTTSSSASSVHSHRDTGPGSTAVTGCITGPVPSAFGSYKPSGPESPYHPFELVMANATNRRAAVERLLQQQKQQHQSVHNSHKHLPQQALLAHSVQTPDAPPLPLYQLVDTVNYLGEAVTLADDGDSAYTNPKVASDTLGRLSNLVRTALDCLRGPPPLFFFHGDLSGAQTPTSPEKLTPVTSAQSITLHQHDDLVNTMYATPESYLMRHLPENTVVSFYVSEGNVVTEVRVFDNPDLHNVSSNNSSLDLSSVFSLFRRGQQNQHAHVHTNQHESGAGGSALLRVPSAAHLHSGSSGNLMHQNVHRGNTGNSGGDSNSDPGTPGESLIRDFVRVESPDPSLISSGAKLRALLSHIDVLKRRLDLIG